MVKQTTCLILAAGLALAGVPAGAQGPNTVWGSVPQGVSEAATAVLLDTADKILVRVPIVDGKFAFRDIGPGQYVVALQTSLGREVARSCPVGLTIGSEQEAIFSCERVPAAVLPSGGLSKTAWILIGAAAVGITTAAIIIAHKDNVASPSR
jgi:hypothetical protein